MHSLETKKNTSPVAIVTGSTSCIGRNIAEALYRDGFSVVFNGRTDNALETIVSDKVPERTLAVKGDVSDSDFSVKLVKKVLEKYGRIDVLVCNVGSGSSVSPGDETYSEWQKMLALNFFSTTNMVEASKEALKASSGSVVCISSICGLEIIPGAPLTYSVSKAALNAYIRGIARPLGEIGVRINGIAPGNINFVGSVWEKKLKNTPESVKQMLSKEVALKRLGAPSDITSLVLWLVSKDASFATGAVFTLDGGQVKGF